MIKNPEYKGKWSAPLIDNPAYKGPWAPRKIANPGYYEDKTPSNMEPMGAVSFPFSRSIVIVALDPNVVTDWFRDLDHAERYPVRQHLHRSLC
jgi:hypothetical protein